MKKANEIVIAFLAKNLAEVHLHLLNLKKDLKKDLKNLQQELSGQESD